jgi:ATP synthase protein I
MTSKSPDSPAISRPSRIRGDVATKTRDAYRSWSASSVGLEMGIAVVIGLLFGRFLDGKLGTDPWLMLVFTGFGMAAGLKGVFRAVREADKIAADNEAAAKDPP